MVRGTSGHPQLFLVREGRCHAIASPDWPERHEYVLADVMLIEDSVILEIPAGDVLT
jgi:hypothetical protein